MKGPTIFKSVVDVLTKLNTDLGCRNYLKWMLWGGDRPPGCPRCGNVTTYHFKDGKTHKCAACRQKFNLLTGTIFENTKLPLSKWIAGIWMASSYKRGISSYQVARNIGVTQKTAWFMMQRIRKLFEKMRPETLEGTCTADETYIGGKQKNKHMSRRVKGQQGRGSSEKINVFGVMQVGGMVLSQAVADVKISTLQPIIRQHVAPGSTMMTDEWHGYNGLSSTYAHQVCDHGSYQYVSDNGATTNPIENYWSHLKRAVIGTYYHLTRKHIARYLAEFDYKFNYRSMSDGDRFGLTLSKLYNTRLTYNQLIGKA
jgi:transposase-like protein